MAKDRIHYEHDETWREDFANAIAAAAGVLKLLEKQEYYGITLPIDEFLEDESSDYYRFLEVLYDEILLDGEMLNFTTAWGNPRYAGLDHLHKKKKRKSYEERF